MYLALCHQTNHTKFKSVVTIFIHIFSQTAVVITCERNNGGCDHDCNEIENGVICSCHDGYQLVDNKDCAGTQDNYFLI